MAKQSSQQSKNGKSKKGKIEEPAEELQPVAVSEQQWETQEEQPAVGSTGWDSDLTPNTPAGELNWSSEETAEMEQVASDDGWGAEAADSVPLQLNIEQHAGVFDPSIVKILIFGDTGSHKTRTAATFPNVIFADIDHGMSSVDWEVDKVRIETDDGEKGFKQLKDLYKYLKNSDHGYDTVVLDTLNEMQRVIMRFTIEEYTHIRRSYGNLPGQSDYGKMLYEFLEVTRDFIALPMRVILLAQVNTQQFDTDILGPQLVGKNSAKEIMRKMDVVGYIYKQAGEDDRTHPEIAFDSPQYSTKDRSYKLPAILPNPSYDRISAFWK